MRYEREMAHETEWDRMRHSLKLSEGPLEEYRKQQELMDRMFQPDSSAMHMMRAMREQNHITKLAEQFDALNRHSALIEATQSMMTRPGVLEQIETASRRANEMQSLMDRALTPDRLGLAEMAQKMATEIGSFKAALMTGSAWSRLLEDQMAAVSTPWLQLHLASLSFEGFAVVSRLGQIVRHADPFDDPTREQIDEDLGDPVDVEDDAGPDERDVAHVDAGMTPSMLAISPFAIGDVMIQTGFIFKAEFAPIPATMDGSDPGHVFHPGHNILITTVEQNLRSVVADKMRMQYGETWLDMRVDPALVQDWNNRRDEAVAHGESPFDLIQYSNFMELKDIIIRRQHWREVFEPIFKKKEHFATSMERLHPIRLPLSHSRPIGIGQQYHLISEAALILRALGIDIFRSS
jgi:hypothetical protein